MKSFFRYAKNRFLYNLIRLLILLVLGYFFVVFKVSAASGSYTSAKYHYCQYGASNTCYLNSSTFNQNLGTMTTFDPYDILQSFGFTFTGSYSSDNTYSVTSTVYLDYIELVTTGTSTYTAYDVFARLINSYTIRGCTTTGNCSNWIDITPIAIASVTDDTSTTSNYRLLINFTFKSNIDLKQVDINYIFNQDSPLYSASYLYQFRVNTINITYEEGTSNQLLQQQIANQQATNQHLQDLQKEINDLNNNSTNNTNNIINNQQENTQDIINNQQQNTQDILDSNKETQDTINNNFNDCRDSYNLFNYQSTNVLSNVVPSATLSGVGDNFSISSTTNGLLAFPVGLIDYNTIYRYMTNSYLTASISLWVTDNPTYSNWTSYLNARTQLTTNWKTTSYDLSNYQGKYLWIQLRGNSEGYNYESVTYTDFILSNQIVSKYEPYGEQICTNRIDETNDKLDDLTNTIVGEGDFEDSSCGIICKLKKLPEAFGNILIGLFVPENGYFESWYEDFKTFMEAKLGFLVYPFTLLIDFLNSFINITSDTDVIINIPDITIPNFEEYKIVEATTFNWSELLRSKESLNFMWNLYLDFIDVYLILNFLNYCSNQYSRIFGGDMPNYEYYTVEDSYTYDNKTGEVLSTRRNERRTRRKKVVD